LFDAVVIGGGPAGLSAATWFGRYRRRTLVVDSGEYRNRWVERVHGVLGHDPVAPEELLRAVHEDLGQYPHVELRRGIVTGLGRTATGDFVVSISDADPVAARRLVLAAGVEDEFPNVTGFAEHYGHDVFHCPTCDGFDAKGECVAVFGWDRHVAGFALELLDWASEVRVVTNGRTFDAEENDRRTLSSHGIEIIEDEVVALLGEAGALEGVELKSGMRTACTMGFFSIGHRPRNTLARQLGCEVDDLGYVVVDDECETSVPGVYAAGDLTPGMQLVAVGVGKGAIAGVACAVSLHGQEDVPGAPQPAPDVAAELDGL
jgi:thioredoxin reductase